MPDRGEPGDKSAPSGRPAESAPQHAASSEDGDAAARRQRDELETILDSVPAYIWYKDPRNRILRANRLAAESMNLSVADLQGRSTYDLYPEEAGSYYEDDLEVMRTGRPKLGIIERLQVGVRKIWVSTDKVPYRDADGSIIGVIVFAVDITDKVLAEQALQRAHDELELRVKERTAQLEQMAGELRNEIAERKRAQENVRRKDAELAQLQRIAILESVAAELAHELNQPLAAIVNFAQGMRRRLQGGVDDVAPLLGAAEAIDAQATRAANVVVKLRELVGRYRGRRLRCDVRRVVSDAVALIEAEAQARGATIRSQLANDLGDVTIDPVQIQQVVVNLLLNALEAGQASPEQTPYEIAVRVAQRGAGIEVSVVDQGNGFQPGTEEEMFHPFYTTKEGGLGMGLAISRAIVTAHGGRIWGRASTGAGATFSFTLPYS